MTGFSTIPGGSLAGFLNHQPYFPHLYHQPWIIRKPSLWWRSKQAKNPQTTSQHSKSPSMKGDMDYLPTWKVEHGHMNKGKWLGKYSLHGVSGLEFSLYPRHPFIPPQVNGVFGVWFLGLDTKPQEVFPWMSTDWTFMWVLLGGDELFRNAYGKSMFQQPLRLRALNSSNIWTTKTFQCKQLDCFGHFGGKDIPKFD